MIQASLPAAGIAAPTSGPSGAFDWSGTELGSTSTWPPALLLAVDIVHNTPLPMLLLWGPRRVAVYNHPYAALAGLRADKVPGGAVPAMLPSPLQAAPDAFARAMGGASVHLQGQQLDTVQDGALVRTERDLHLTPVRDAQGQVAGVLCCIAPAAPAPGAAPAASAPAALRVLVVEDNLDSQYLVCEMLKAFGHDADGVGDAEAALAMLAARHYDVLFSDVSLPGMSGVDLARLAVGSQPALNVIFASGYGDALLRHVEFPHQSLQKPYELEHLQQALARISAQGRSGV